MHLYLARTKLIQVVILAKITNIITNIRCLSWCVTICR